jgi:hypothetical protein
MMQVPSVVQPKSNPAMFTPANRVRPELEVAVADADVDVDVWGVDVADFEVEVTSVLLDLAVPGRHCE